MGVGGIDHQDIDAGVDQCHRPVPGILSDADGRADQKSAITVLGGQRVLLGLDEILDGDQTGKAPMSVDDGQFLNLVAPQQTQGCIGGDALLRGDQRRLGHHLGHPLVHIHFEAHVAVGDDARQRAVAVNHRQAGDMEPGAHGVDFGQGVVR